MHYLHHSLVAQMVNNHLQCGRPGFDPWVGKIPCRRAWQPTPVFLPGKSPWTGEPGRLQSMGSQRVRHDSAIKRSTAPHIWLEKCCFLHLYIQQTTEQFFLCEVSVFSTENSELDKAWSSLSGESLHTVESFNSLDTHLCITSAWRTPEYLLSPVPESQTRVKNCMCMLSMVIPCRPVGNSCALAIVTFLKLLWLFCWPHLWVRQASVGKTSGEHLLDILWAHLLSMIVIMISVLFPNEGRLEYPLLTLMCSLIL